MSKDMLLGNTSLINCPKCGQTHMRVLDCTKPRADRDLTLGGAEAYRRALRDAAAVADCPCDGRFRDGCQDARCGRRKAAAILALEPRAGGEAVVVTGEEINAALIDQHRAAQDAVQPLLEQNNAAAARIAELEAEVAKWQQQWTALSDASAAEITRAWKGERAAYAAGAAAMREAALEAIDDLDMQADALAAYSAVRALPLPDAAQAPKENDA